MEKKHINVIIKKQSPKQTQEKNEEILLFPIYNFFRLTAFRSEGGFFIALPQLNLLLFQKILQPRFRSVFFRLCSVPFGS